MRRAEPFDPWRDWARSGQAGLRTRLAVRLYGLLFRLLILVVPHVEELDVMLEMLDGER
jgi:hypothetical protein